jgi:hypothetical protein
MLVLALADSWCYSITLPVALDIQNGNGAFQVGNTTLPLGQIGVPTQLQFEPHDPVIHEYQIDGTDSTNNFTLDTPYLHQIASSPYYRFQAWMRNLDGTSHWHNLLISTNTSQQLHLDDPPDGFHILLPSSTSLHIRLQLQRPETPLTFDLLMQDKTVLHFTLDRNDRYISVTRDTPQHGDNLSVAKTFFPTDTAPFAAMVIDTLLRTTIWSILLLLIVLVAETIIAVLHKQWQAKSTLTRTNRPLSFISMRWPNETVNDRDKTRLHPRNPGRALHSIAFVALLASFLFTLWISLVQYHAEPHIFDASAYLFAAKMYALGRLSVPIPAAIDRFPGPFMVQAKGQWFGQYAPGTALTLVPGIWLGIPWLVEPLLGTLALLGIGLIATRLYNRQVAALAVILGTLSPFYSYLAASYLSHTIALFYLVWGLWALLRFAQGKAVWHLPLSAALFGMAGLTRDLDAVLFVIIVIVGVILLSWPQVRRSWRTWLVGGTLFLVVALLFFGLYAMFNAQLTGSPWITPRSLFSAEDHWGVGLNVGFYGQHTLAAGSVNLDELLTILAIDLFGWPFYLTFAFLLMPFLTRRAVAADWFLLLAAVIMAGIYIGYFYHGIYLGPRYLYDTLPFLLILTARGIFSLFAAGTNVWLAFNTYFTTPSQIHTTPPPRRIAISAVTVALVGILIACNILYFLPRQIELHTNYTGLPTGYRLDLATVYHPPLHKAIVVTDDFFIYQFVLFPLNDPYLQNDVIYALASNTSDYTELRHAYPGRTLYHLKVKDDGSVNYALIEDSR